MLRSVLLVSLVSLVSCAGIGGSPFENLSERRVRHRVTGMVLVRVEAGRFVMGSPEGEVRRDRDEVRHPVTIDRPFLIGETEVTVGQWRQVMGRSAPELEGRPDDEPVAGVSWHRAQAFVEALNRGTPGWRLPSEEEWEYACRAGTTTPFSFGENVNPDQVNYDGQRPYADAEKGLRRNGPVAVRSLPANPWGLYEIQGNLWEWVEDRYVVDRTADTGPSFDLGGPRVIRGGAYTRGADGSRCAYRDGYPPASAGPKYGLRLARSL